MTLEAKARVREHVRKIQSSARTGAAPAVRPNPAPQFQVPATSQPPSHPNFENPLKVDSQVRNGLDSSYVPFFLALFTLSLAVCNYIPR